MASAMGETDVTFRHLLRGLPRPILRLAFPRDGGAAGGDRGVHGSEEAGTVDHASGVRRVGGRDAGNEPEAADGEAADQATRREIAQQGGWNNFASRRPHRRARPRRFFRSFRVTPAVRARIERETDVTRLESSHEAAVTARAIGDVFRDG